MEHLLSELDRITEKSKQLKSMTANQLTEFTLSVIAFNDRMKDKAERVGKFYYKVAEMRKYQVEYFAAIKIKNYTVSGPALKNSKLLEKEIDAKIAEIKAGVSQPKIF